MAILLEFYNIIMPIWVIEEKYPGGFAAFKAERTALFEWDGDQAPALWHDAHLCCVGGAMDPDDIAPRLDELQRMMDLEIIEGPPDCQKFKDVYVDGSFQGAVYDCDWIESACSWVRHRAGIDVPVDYVYLAGTDPGLISPIQGDWS